MSKKNPKQKRKRKQSLNNQRKIHIDKNRLKNPAKISKKLTAKRGNERSPAFYKAFYEASQKKIARQTKEQSRLQKDLLKYFKAELKTDSKEYKRLQKEILKDFEREFKTDVREEKIVIKQAEREAKYSVKRERELKKGDKHRRILLKRREDKEIPLTVYERDVFDHSFKYTMDHFIYNEGLTKVKISFLGDVVDTDVYTIDERLRDYFEEHEGGERHYFAYTFFLNYEDMSWTLVWDLTIKRDPENTQEFLTRAQMLEEVDLGFYFFKFYGDN